MDCDGFREVNGNLMALFPLFHLPHAHCAHTGNSADVKMKRMRAGLAEIEMHADSRGKLQLVIKFSVF